MKIRIASLMLAIGLILPAATVAFANGAVENPELSLEDQGVLEGEQPTAVFYLDGEPLYDVVAQSIDGTYYVTLGSLLPMIDASAMVEESSEMAAVSAQAVVVTEPAVQSGDESAVVSGTEAAAVILGMEETAENLAEGQSAAVPSLEGDEVQDSLQVGEAVTEVLDTLTMTAQVGQQYVVANGRYLYVEDGVITLDGAVAVPVRVLAEALNLTAQYDDQTGCVYLTRSQQIGYLEDAETFYDSDDLYWLSRIIYCESGNQVMSGKIAVGNVVLNRVNNGRFPDTVYDVIFQKNQFSPASSGSIYRDPNESSVVAAKLVLDGAEVLENALFFNRAGLVCYASKNRPYVATIGDHAFYA